MGEKLVSVLLILMVSFVNPIFVHAEQEPNEQAKNHSLKQIGKGSLLLPEMLPRFTHDSGYNFPYPDDGVRGIYVTGNSAGGQRFETLLELLNSTDLNSMVIDIKDDHGYLTFRPDEDSPYYDISQNFIGDIDGLMKTLEDNNVYPIARVVVFKDSVLAKEKPEWSFLEDGQVWENRRNESFVNPFLQEVWDYNVEIAEKAAQLGFKEIQFDYVRFPEGFERRDEDLEYEVGEYDGEDDNVQKRVTAVTDFVAYARERLSKYDVDVSVDIFGYAATISEAPGIGQNFANISDNVDVISSMIYPSHWTPYFGIDKPDLYPYELTKAYAEVENEVLAQLDDPPVSRPWIQDFTASWLGSGNYIKYGKDEVEAQIRALYEEDINEFLLWNASNRYTEGVDYLNPS
ncbi:putative glycoside hydrolase [Halalkalibacter sp. APA_J-10(15)]|uniref:putative glycoside hydrolase n=1 Tax=unclassified Halalkalibacter TaxID=2893063 RepID=UPI001FF652DD|nr:putative glycoside hydrolase [Halalkalibacter sp. APA_J-10(15)]MCK0472622.1 putative glycoside hydrolase [Halalkalibacter sp. APA_J-10(15)]